MLARELGFRPVDQGLVDFLHEGPHTKYFRICSPCDVFQLLHSASVA